METIGWRRDWMQWLTLDHYNHSLGTILASSHFIQPSPTYKLCIAVRCQVMGVSSLVYIRLGMLVILCILNGAVSIYIVGATVDPRSLVTLSICRLECHHFNKSSPTRLQFDNSWWEVEWESRWLLDSFCTHTIFHVSLIVMLCNF